MRGAGSPTVDWSPTERRVASKLNVVPRIPSPEQTPVQRHPCPPSRDRRSPLAIALSPNETIAPGTGPTGRAAPVFVASRFRDARGPELDLMPGRAERWLLAALRIQFVALGLVHASPHPPPTSD